MNGNKAVLDSNVIIDFSKGKFDINKLSDNYPYFFVSIISYVELLGYNFMNKKEQIIIENILKHIPIVNIDVTIADVAINYRKKNKIKLPDALILSTASIFGADLITSNVRDFINIEKKINIVNPFI